MIDFEVSLVGRPKVSRRGEFLEVRPKVVFELLIAILWKGRHSSPTTTMKYYLRTTDDAKIDAIQTLAERRRGSKSGE